MKDIDALLRQEELFEEYRMLKVEINNLKNRHHELRTEVDNVATLLDLKRTNLDKLWFIVCKVVQDDRDPIELKLRDDNSFDMDFDDLIDMGKIK